MRGYQYKYLSFITVGLICLLAVSSADDRTVASTTADDEILQISDIGDALASESAPSNIENTADEENICEEGFYYNTTSQVCMRNVCVCENGIAVTDDDCEKQGKNQCFACNEGFILGEDDMTCQAVSDTSFGPPPMQRPKVQKVCRNSDVMEANMTLADWVRTPEFLKCTDLLFNVRVGDSGDEGARIIGARLVEVGSASQVRALFLTGNSISDKGFAWIVAALGGDIPEDAEDEANSAPYFLTAGDENSELDEEAAEAVRRAGLIRDRIGYPSLPVTRGKGLAPIEVLNLYRNYITDDGLEPLADALRAHPTVREIHLSNNRITVDGVESLVDAVHQIRRSRE